MVDRLGLAPTVDIFLTLRADHIIPDWEGTQTIICEICPRVAVEKLILPGCGADEEEIQAFVELGNGCISKLTTPRDNLVCHSIVYEDVADGKADLRHGATKAIRRRLSRKPRSKCCARF